MRALGRLIGGLLSIAVGFALLGALVFLGTGVYDYFNQGPWTPPEAAQAAMKRLAGADISAGADSVQSLVEIIGQPEYTMPSPSLVNVRELRWYRGAIRVQAIGDRPIRVQIEPSRWGYLMPLSRPPFRGLFLGLRIGDPAPAAAQADEVKRSASAGHDADWVQWEVSDGRISSIDYGRKVIWTPAPKK